LYLNRDAGYVGIAWRLYQLKHCVRQGKVYAQQHADTSPAEPFEKAALTNA
jgi:hypothetical protein